MKDLVEYTNNLIWIKEYPIHYAGTEFNSRMTIVRLANGDLFIHSPCEIDEHTQAEIERLGKVAFIVAPGSYHYFYISSAQKAFPEAETFICPGIERKCPAGIRWEVTQNTVLSAGCQHVFPERMGYSAGVRGGRIRNDHKDGDLP